MAQNKFIKWIRHFLRSIGLVSNLIVVIWLFLCFVASFYDVSDKPSYLSFFSFSNVFAVFFNFIFIGFWLFSKRKWLSLFSLFSILICLPIVKSSFGFKLFGADANFEDSQLKVMTWNVHLFDLGEWTRNKQTKNKILDFIKEQDPDILCLQEYYHDKENPNEPYLDLLRELGYGYSEFVMENDHLKSSLNISFDKGLYIDVGTAIFSKFPLSNPEKIKLHGGIYKILGVDVTLVNNKKVRLYTTHLQSVTLSNSEVAYAEQKAGEMSAKVEDKTKGILYKLMMASSKRAIQANEIDSITSKSTLPTVVCGDFNDMPGSYVYRKIKGDLSDVFSKKGFGLGRTYRKIVPTLRIDYIFYDDEFLDCNAYSSPDISLSDHNPVIATFSIKEKEKK